MQASPTLPPPEKPTIHLAEVFSNKTDRNANSHSHEDQEQTKQQTTLDITTQAQLREGAASVGLAFPANPVCLGRYLEARSLRNREKKKQTQSQILSHELLQALWFAFPDSYKESGWLGDYQMLFFLLCEEAQPLQQPTCKGNKGGRVKWHQS